MKKTLEIIKLDLPNLMRQARLLNPVGQLALTKNNLVYLNIGDQFINEPKFFADAINGTIFSLSQ